MRSTSSNLSYPTNRAYWTEPPGSLQSWLVKKGRETPGCSSSYVLRYMESKREISRTSARKHDSILFLLLHDDATVLRMTSVIRIGPNCQNWGIFSHAHSVPLLFENRCGAACCVWIAVHWVHSRERFRDLGFRKEYLGHQMKAILK